MAGSVSILVVVGPSGKVALRVPASVTVADLLAEALAAVGGEPETTTRWLLSRPKGDALDVERTVGQLGLKDGSLLVLRAADEAEEEIPSEDLPEAVAAVVESEEGQWSATDVGTLCSAVAAASVAGAAAAVAQMPLSVEQGALALGAGVAALALGAVAARSDELARLGRWVALAGLLLWAVAGAAIAAPLGSGIAAAGAVGVLIGALAVWFAIPASRPVASAVGLGAAVFGLGASVMVPPLRLGPDVAAGVTAVLALAVLGLLPMISVEMTGLLEIDSAEAGARRLLEQSVASGRNVLAWLIAGDSALLAGAAVVLSVAGGPYALALAAVVSVAAALQARHHGFRAEAAPLVLGAVIGLGAVEVGLLLHHVPQGWVAAAGGAMAACDIAAAITGVVVAGRFSSTVDSRRWLSLLEFVANVAVIPLLLGVAGLYEFVFTQAKHLL